MLTSAAPWRWFLTMGSRPRVLPDFILITRCQTPNPEPQTQNKHEILKPLKVRVFF